MTTSAKSRRILVWHVRIWNVISTNYIRLQVNPPGTDADWENMSWEVSLWYSSSDEAYTLVWYMCISKAMLPNHMQPHSRPSDINRGISTFTGRLHPLSDHIDISMRKSTKRHWPMGGWTTQRMHTSSVCINIDSKKLVMACACWPNGIDLL